MFICKLDFVVIHWSCVLYLYSMIYWPLTKPDSEISKRDKPHSPSLLYDRHGSYCDFWHSGVDVVYGAFSARTYINTNSLSHQSETPIEQNKHNTWMSFDRTEKEVRNPRRRTSSRNQVQCIFLKMFYLFIDFLFSHHIPTHNILYFLQSPPDIFRRSNIYI